MLSGMYTFDKNSSTCLWITSIGRSIRNNSIRHKFNLHLIPLIGGKLLGTSLRNASWKFYNKETKILGKEMSKLLVLKQASFVWKYNRRPVRIKSSFDLTLSWINARLFLCFSLNTFFVPTYSFSFLFYFSRSTFYFHFLFLFYWICHLYFSSIFFSLSF